MALLPLSHIGDTAGTLSGVVRGQRRLQRRLRVVHNVVGVGVEVRLRVSLLFRTHTRPDVGVFSPPRRPGIQRVSERSGGGGGGSGVGHQVVVFRFLGIRGNRPRSGSIAKDGCEVMRMVCKWYRVLVMLRRELMIVLGW